MFSDYIKRNLDMETWLPPLYKEFSWICMLATSLNRGVYLKYSKRKIYPNVFIMLIGGSGTGKGVVIDDTIKEMLEQIDVQLILPDYSTPEALLKVLSNNGKGIIAVDEASTLLSTREYMKDMSDYLTYLYNAHKEIIQISRAKNNKTYTISQPYLNIIMGVQPKLIKKIVNEYDIASGFLQRFFIVYSEAEKEKEVVNDDESWKMAYKILKRIYEYFSNLAEPFQMMLSTSGLEEIRNYIDRVEREYDDEIFSRWRDLLLKLCIIMQVDKYSEKIEEVDSEELEVIGLDVVKRAIEMMQRLEDSAMKIVDEVRSTKDSEIMDKIKETVEKLIEKGKYLELEGRKYILRRELLMNLRVKVEFLEPYLRTLQELDYFGEKKFIGKKIAYEYLGKEKDEKSK